MKRRDRESIWKRKNCKVRNNKLNHSKYLNKTKVAILNSSFGYSALRLRYLWVFSIVLDEIASLGNT